MQKINNYLTIFFLWLAGLTLSVHYLLPHDHHLPDSLSNQESSCPAKNSQSGPSRGFPLHCHAFNDIATEKAKLLSLSLNTTIIFVATNDGIFPASSDLPSFLFNINYFEKPVLNSFALESSLLRAPPALS
jgi:hypothetical protein